MAFLPIDLAQKIRDMIAHVVPLPPEAGVPLAHFDRSISDIWNLLMYFERNFKRVATPTHCASRTWRDCME